MKHLPRKIKQVIILDLFILHNFHLLKCFVTQNFYWNNHLLFLWLAYLLNCKLWQSFRKHFLFFCNKKIENIIFLINDCYLLNDLGFQILSGFVLEKWINLRKLKQRRDSHWMLTLSHLFLVSSGKCHLWRTSESSFLEIIVVMLRVFWVMIMRSFPVTLIFDIQFPRINSIEISDIITRLLKPQHFPNDIIEND